MTKKKTFNAVLWRIQQWKKQGFVPCSWPDLWVGRQVRVQTIKGSVQGRVTKNTRASLWIGDRALSRTQVLESYYFPLPPAMLFNMVN